MEEIIKKLMTALQDEDTAKELEKFGIKADQIEGYKDLKVPATLDEALENKDIQSEFDRRLAKAAETREENLKKKFDFKSKEEQPPKPSKEDNPDPMYQKLIEKLEQYDKKFEAMEKEKQQLTVAQKREKAQSLLKEKGIPPIYVHELDLEKDLDEQLETVSKRFEEEFKPLADKGKKPGTKVPFPSGAGNNEPSKEEAAKFKSLF